MAAAQARLAPDEAADALELLVAEPALVQPEGRRAGLEVACRMGTDVEAVTATRPWGLPCPSDSRPSPKPRQATPGLSAEPGHRGTQALTTPTPYSEPQTVPGTVTTYISCCSRAIDKWAGPRACVPSPGVAPLPPTHARHLAPHLSSRLMSTPTEGGAAKMSVIRGRNRCRISFREVQPVWT